MTIFQIKGATEDPVTRYTAFWSLICALLSLLYGCLFIIRFGSMRKASGAAKWAKVNQNQIPSPVATDLWFIASTKAANCHLVECVGHVSHASCVDVLVRLPLVHI